MKESVARQLFFIDVTDGEISACDTNRAFDQRNDSATLSIDELDLHGETAVARLSRILVAFGLNKSEADGLVDCWRPQFFETDGKRLVTVFGKSEYDMLCPMSVSPAPTEFARVGLVLTEFGN